jgi:predicted site-specific integrase-resolvase
MSQKSIVVGDGLVEKQAIVDYLQVTVRTVKTWTKRRKIPSIRIGAKVIRYRLADIGKALRKHCFVAAELVPKEAAK